MAFNHLKIKFSGEKKMPKGKLNSVFMVKENTVVGEAARGRCHPMEYGLLSNMEN